MEVPRLWHKFFTHLIKILMNTDDKISTRETSDKQKQPNKENIEGSNDSKLPDTPPPGQEKDDSQVSKNPNPRANENLNSPGTDKNKIGHESTSQVGSEITDGEDG
jgi:hypothetical protein